MSARMSCVDGRAQREVGDLAWFFKESGLGIPWTPWIESLGSIDGYYTAHVC